MRRYLPVLILMAASLGCKGLGLQPRDPNAPPKATGAIPERTAADLVNYLNTKAGLVQSLSFTDVSVTATENGKDMPRLGDSSLFASQPRNFRLMCGTNLTSGEVDLGANDREFWMYVKRMDGPNYFYCSHDDFSKGAGKRFPIPFDVNWVMQALGMATFDPNGQFEIRTYAKQRKYVLEEKATTPNGVTVRKLIAFNIDHDDGRRPVVAKHFVADSQDQVLASAEILSVRKVSVKDSSGTAHYMQVPTEVVLEWPQQKFKMRLTLDREKVNDDLRDRAALLFNRPQIRGSNPIDLATYSFNPTSYR
jgi:hypothetical protein